MGDYFCMCGNRIVADVSVQPGGAYGTGCFESPILVVPLVINFTGPQAKGSALYFREIRCRVSPMDQSYIAENRPNHLNYILRTGGSLPNSQVLLEIPLDQLRLSRIDHLRKGGDLKLRLDTELIADELVQIGDSGKFPDPEVWGFKRQHIAHQHIHVVIPRSNWVQQVLPNTYFGKIHIIELPTIPIASCAALQQSYDALQQASKLVNEGYFQEAVAKCRIALQPFFEIGERPDDSGKMREVPVLKRSWEKRIGKATYDWLDSSLAGLKGPGNDAAHRSSISFGQLEAQMILTVTVAVVAYAVKMQPESTT